MGWLSNFLDYGEADWLVKARLATKEWPIIRVPVRERILALYRQQGRPQAHLDRVMRLGRESPEDVRKQWEARFRTARV